MKKIILITVLFCFVTIVLAQTGELAPPTCKPKAKTVNINVPKKEEDTDVKNIEKKLEQAFKDLKQAKNKIEDMKKQNKNLKSDKSTSDKEKVKATNEVERLSNLVFKLQKDLVDLSLEMSKNSRISETELKQLKNLLDRSIDIIKIKDEIITKQQDSISYLQDINGDYIDTEYKRIKIGKHIFSYENPIMYISGFGANSSKTPIILKDDAEFLGRLKILLLRQGLKLKLTGTCNYGKMIKKDGEKLALSRAYDFRNYLINTMSFDENTLGEISGSTKCTNCSAVILEIMK